MERKATKKERKRIVELRMIGHSVNYVARVLDCSERFVINTWAEMMKKHPSLNLRLRCHTTLLGGQRISYKIVDKEKYKVILPETNNSKQYFQCQYCTRLFGNTILFQSHIRHHEKTFLPDFHKKNQNPRMFETKESLRALQCKYCTRLFGNFYLFKSHIRRHEKNFVPYWLVNDFTCMYCNKKFSGKVSKFHHEMSHTEENPYQCIYCHKCFAFSSARTKHEKTHCRRADKKPHQCKFCNKHFKHMHFKKFHEVTHTLPRKHYTCKFCDMEFLYFHSLNLHVKKHTGKTPYQCRDCQKKFTSEHDKNAHKERHKSTEKKYEGEPHRCKQCGKYTFLIYQSKQDDSDADTYFKCKFCTEKQQTERLFSCQYCKKYIPSQRLKDVHELMNCQKKPAPLHQCKYCSMCFSLFSRKVRHEMIHASDLKLQLNKPQESTPAEENQYQCNYCIKRFTSKSYRDNHESLHTTETLYDNEVQHEIIQASDLNLQLNKQNKFCTEKQQRQFSCQYCKKYFHSQQFKNVHEMINCPKKLPKKPAPHNRCKYCSMCFFFFSRKVQHEMIHASNLKLQLNKPQNSTPAEKNHYQCNYCIQCFTSQNYRDNHESLHTGEKLYKCRCCEKRFRSDYARFRHEKKHLESDKR